MVIAKAFITMNQAATRDAGNRAGLTLVNQLSRRVAETARAEAPARTGFLRNSIRPAPATIVGNKIVGGVEAHAEYGIFVHQGTKPHMIYPRKAKALRFTIGGRTVYAKSVRHPGTRPQPFLLTALNKEAPRLGFFIFR